MEYPTKVTVALKGENSSYRSTDLIYAPYTLREDDPVIAELIKAAKEEFKAPVEKITITCKICYE